jgi:hypothetical protein
MKDKMDHVVASISGGFTYETVPLTEPCTYLVLYAYESVMEHEEWLLI